MLEFAPPRDKTTGHRRDEASAGAAVDTGGKGGFLPNEEFGGDGAGGGEAIIFGAGNVPVTRLACSYWHGSWFMVYGSW